MVLPANFWLLFLAAMVISSIGFKNYVWFISLGYGFSIAGEGLLLLLLYGKTLTPGTIICCILFIIYGCRLGGYLAFREFKSTSYKKNMTGEIKDGKTIPMGVKIAIWVTCAALYVTQVSGVFYRLHNGSGSNIWTYVGAVVMLFGLVLETAADTRTDIAADNAMTAIRPTAAIPFLIKSFHLRLHNPHHKIPRPVPVSPHVQVPENNIPHDRLPALGSCIVLLCDCNGSLP